MWKKCTWPGGTKRATESLRIVGLQLQNEMQDLPNAEQEYQLSS